MQLIQLTMIWYRRRPTQPLLSVARMTRLNVSLLVGEPDKTPVDASSVSPLGDAPRGMLKLYGAVPPIAM